MNTQLVICLAVLSVFAVPIRAETIDTQSSIDPFCFLAGIVTTGADMGYIDPPQCDSFFKSSGEKRVAELFLEVAQRWTKRTSSETSAFRYYESGGRFIVENRNLSEALRTFYDPPKRFDIPNVASIASDRDKRLSFLAGIYARCFIDGGFHSRPSAAMSTTVMILLAEGCEVSDLRYDDERMVPGGVHFKVKPSARVARLFALVDKWQPSHVKWEYIEWKAK